MVDLLLLCRSDSYNNKNIVDRKHQKHYAEESKK